MGFFLHAHAAGDRCIFHGLVRYRIESDGGDLCVEGNTQCMLSLVVNAVDHSAVDTGASIQAYAIRQCKNCRTAVLAQHQIGGHHEGNAYAHLIAAHIQLSGKHTAGGAKGYLRTRFVAAVHIIGIKDTVFLIALHKDSVFGAQKHPLAQVEVITTTGNAHKRFAVTG